jgi:hypothetical protein
MIGYILSKSLLMIRRRWKSQLPLALQMAAGVAVIHACAALWVSAAEEYRLIREEIGGTVWNIVITPEQPSSRPPLDDEHYAQLKARFPEASFPFCIVRTVHYTTDGADLRTGRFLYASDDFLASVLRADRPGFERGNAAYAGDGIRGLLDGRYRLIFGHVPPELVTDGEREGESVGRLSVLPMDELGAAGDRFTHHDLADWPLDRTVLLPLASYDPSHAPQTPEDAALFLLSVRFGRGMDADEAIATFAQILGLLLEWNEDWRFAADAAGQRLLGGYGELREGAAAAGGVAALGLAIVLTGLAAVVQLQFLGRRKAFAVCSAFGARKGVLFAEMLLEAALPSCAGGITGAVIGFWCLRAWADAVEIRTSPAVAAAAAVLALAPAMLAAGALASRFRRLRPLEILRGDQA